MNERWLVVGGGFTGIAGAYLLAQSGHRVTLVDRRGIGGVTSGIHWQGYDLDLGCHVFGNESDEVTSMLLDLLGGDAHPVHLRMASELRGQRLEGFELPDLSVLGEVEQMLSELIAAQATPAPPASSLAALLTTRFGATAAAHLGTLAEKFLAAPATELAAEAVNATCFRRIRLVPDAMAAVLKQSPALDAVLAMGSQDDPMRFYRDHVRGYPHRAFYPASGGMRGFACAARARLVALGVEVVTGVEIESIDIAGRIELRLGDRTITADRALWAAGAAGLERTWTGASELEQHIAATPMVLYYFPVRAKDVGPYSYVNCFDTARATFRASVPGTYGKDNAPAGMSYVCCEVPTSIGSPRWHEPEQSARDIWNEIVELGVASGAPAGLHTLRTPVSYKAPKTGFAAASAAIRHRAESSPLVLADEWGFSKNRIITELRASLPLAGIERAA